MDDDIPDIELQQDSSRQFGACTMLIAAVAITQVIEATRRHILIVWKHCAWVKEEICEYVVITVGA